MPFTPRPGDTLNEYGFWQDLEGSLAPGQETPGMRDNPEATNYYDPDKGGMRYNIRNGQRVYQSDGRRSADPGGGAVHGTPQWNQKTGKYDVGLDWGKILSYAAGAGIGASYIIPALAGGGAGAAPAAGGTLPSTTTVGSSTLGGGLVPGASGGIAAAPSGLVPAAGASGVIPTASTVATLPSTATVSNVGSLPTATPSWSATPGGGNVSFWDSAKDYYDKYKQGKKVYDQGRQVYDTVKGPSNGSNGPSNGPSTPSAVGQTAAAIEKARMDAMIQQARLQQSQDQLAQNRSILALRAPGQEASNSVRGDILANSRDAEFSGLPSYIHVPQMSGGLRPSMLSDNSRALGANMSRQALAHNLSGDDVPNLTALPEAGKLDKALQVTSGISSFWDALSQHGGGGSTPQAPPTDTGGTEYGGEGTPGYPGDNPASPVNPMMPPITSQAPNPDQGGTGIDPEILKWLQDSAQPGAIQ